MQKSTRLRRILQFFARPDTVQLTDPPADAALTTRAAWDTEVKTQVKRREFQAQNAMRLCVVVKGPRADWIRDKNKQLECHQEMELEHDLPQLLTKLQLISCNTHFDKIAARACADVTVRLLNCNQVDSQSLSSYCRVFKARKEVHKVMGGWLGMCQDSVLLRQLEDLRAEAAKTNKPLLKEEMSEWCNEIIKQGRERCVAILAADNASSARYLALKLCLQNECNAGTNRHLSNLADTFKLLRNCTPPRSTHPKVHRASRKSVSLRMKTTRSIR